MTLWGDTNAHGYFVIDKDDTDTTGRFAIYHHIEDPPSTIPGSGDNSRCLFQIKEVGSSDGIGKMTLGNAASPAFEVNWSTRTMDLNDGGWTMEVNSGGGTLTLDGHATIQGTLTAQSGATVSGGALTCQDQLFLDDVSGEKPDPPVISLMDVGASPTKWHLWVDSNGKLRIKPDPRPTHDEEDSEGTVVGTQTA